MSLSGFINQGHLDDSDGYQVPMLDFAVQPAEVLTRTAGDATDVEPKILGNARNPFLVWLSSAPGKAGAQDAEVSHPSGAYFLPVQMDFKSNHSGQV
jgi:hypothetical protein